MTPGYALDTDTLTLLQHGQAAVTARHAATPRGLVAVTVITVSEVVTGWQAEIVRAKHPADIERLYTRLATAVQFLGQFPLLPFSQAAIAEFERLRRAKLNVGSNDLRIAAIALTAGAVVVTRNRRDFGRVPDLVSEDWAAPLAGPPPAA